MAQLTLTAQAQTENLSVLEVRERLATLERRRAMIDSRMIPLQQELRRLLPSEASTAIEEPSVSFESLPELMSDSSYQSDDGYEPSKYDKERENAYYERISTYENAQRSVEAREGSVSRFEYQMRQNPTKIAERQEQNGRIDRSVLGRFRFRDLRVQNEAQIAALQREIQNAEANIDSARKDLEAAKIALKETPGENGPYDPTLHDVEATEFLPREQQSVLFQLVANSGSGGKVFLHIPTTPDQNDFTTTASFELNDDDLHEFASLVGEDIPTPRSIFNTLKENTEVPFDVDLQLVPFPLEVVEIGGERRVRIPQVVWERFKDYVS